MTSILSLSPQQALRLKAALWYGETGEYVADQFGCSLSLVRMISKGDRYPETEWPDGSKGRLKSSRLTAIARARSRARREVYPQITRTMNARVRAILGAAHGD